MRYAPSSALVPVGCCTRNIRKQKAKMDENIKEKTNVTYSIVPAQNPNDTDPILTLFGMEKLKAFGFLFSMFSFQMTLTRFC
jgi:hypothetical protein